MGPVASHHEIITAYRHLRKNLLQAVQYAKPQRIIIHKRLRQAFTKSSPEDFDPIRIARTLELIGGAIASRGYEHRIVKGILHVWWYEQQNGDRNLQNKTVLKYRPKAYADFYRTVEKLNETMGLCIR